MHPNTTTNKNSLLHAVCWIVLVSSCNQPKGFTKGPNETKPTNSLPADNPQGATAGSANRADKINFQGLYDVTIKAKNGDNSNFCQGEASIINYTDGTIFSGTIPCNKSALIKGLVKEIKLSNADSSKTIMLSAEEVKSRNLDSRIQYSTQHGYATYSPFRPDIIGPLVQDRSTYADIDQTFPVSVEIAPNGELTKKEKSEGTIHVKVLEVNGTFDLPKLGLQTGVLRYQINSKGFDKLSDKSAADLFEVYEYRWRTDPPMKLLSVHIESSASDLESSYIKGLFGNLIFRGGIVIDLVLKQITYAKP